MKYNIVPITTVPITGYLIACMVLKSTYLWAIILIGITDRFIRAVTKANPLKPIYIVANGVQIHVIIVQSTIKYNVIFIFPIALSKLVNGTRIAAKAAFAAKKINDTIAGSHL